jgi:hypothetical protein
MYAQVFEVAAHVPLVHFRRASIDERVNVVGAAIEFLDRRVSDRSGFGARTGVEQDGDAK